MRVWPVAVTVALVPVAAVGAYAPPRAPASAQTHPSVTPRRGHPHSRFVLHLTLREDLGVRGLTSTTYRVTAGGGKGSGCTHAAGTVVDHGKKDARIRVTLAPTGKAGWCRGRFPGMVLLERGPYCPPSPRPTPCPEFASQAQDAGRFALVVR